MHVVTRYSVRHDATRVGESNARHYTRGGKEWMAR